jgi:hypothetical protein
VRGSTTSSPIGVPLCLAQSNANADPPELDPACDCGGGHPEKALTRDEMLDQIMLYSLTNTGTAAARLCWDNKVNNFNAVDISIRR